MVTWTRVAQAVLSVIVLSMWAAGEAAAVGPIFVESSALNTNASSDSGTDFTPAVATDDMGNWVAIWRSDEEFSGTLNLGTDEDLLVSRSTDDGGTWSAPAALNTNGGSDSGGDFAPTLASDKAGNWVAVWDSDENVGGTAGTDFDILVSLSSDAGVTWSAPVPLNTNATTDSGSDMEPAIATDGAGTWVVGWHSNENVGGAGIDFDILYAVSQDNGASWTAPSPLNSTATTDTGNDDNVDIAVAAGLWIASWGSAENTGGIGTDFDIFGSRTLDPTSGWGAVQIVNSNASRNGANDGDRFPSVAGDGSTWIIAWQSGDKLGTGGASIGTDEDILYSTSADLGGTWATVQPLNTNAKPDSGEDRRPRIITDGLGEWIAVWDSDDTLSGAVGSDGDILIARSSNDGATWSNPGPLDPAGTSDVGNDSNAAVATDVTKWVAVWNSTDDKIATIGTDADILVSTSDTLCAAVPIGSGVCREPFVPNKSRLIFVNKDPDKRDKLTFKWNKGDDTSLAALGDPITATDYIVCIYDQSIVPSQFNKIFESQIESGGTCKNGKPCWKDFRGKGFNYRNPEATPFGMKAANLRSGVPGKAKVILRGKGDLLGPPQLPLTEPVLVQVKNTEGECWEATFSIPIKDDGQIFKSKDN